MNGIVFVSVSLIHARFGDTMLLEYAFKFGEGHSLHG